MLLLQITLLKRPIRRYLNSMKITIIAVGKIKEKFFRDAIAEYEKRLSKYCKLSILEVNDEKTPDQASEAMEQQILSKEGERIRNLIPKDSYVIPLAIEGKKYDSVGFSDMIHKNTVQGVSHITFVIGGSLGIWEEIKKASPQMISFSDMTFPHRLMRVILLEQIYRAYRIMNGEPYHK